MTHAYTAPATFFKIAHHAPTGNRFDVGFGSNHLRRQRDGEISHRPIGISRVPPGTARRWPEMLGFGRAVIRRFRFHRNRRLDGRSAPHSACPDSDGSPLLDFSVLPDLSATKTNSLSESPQRRPDFHFPWFDTGLTYVAAYTPESGEKSYRSRLHLQG